MPGDYRSRAESAGRRPAAGVGELSPGEVRALPQCCGYRLGHYPGPLRSAHKSRGPHVAAPGVMR